MSGKGQHAGSGWDWIADIEEATGADDANIERINAPSVVLGEIGTVLALFLGIAATVVGLLMAAHV